MSIVYRALLLLALLYKEARALDTRISLGSLIIGAFELPSQSTTSTSLSSNPSVSTTSFSALTSASTLVLTITVPAVVTVIIDPGFGAIGPNGTNLNPSVGGSTGSPGPKTTPTVQNGCGFGEINQDNWEKYNVDSWLLSWWDGKSNFTVELKDTFAPSVAGSSFTCNVFQQCTVGACNDLDLQKDHVREAYFVFEAIANFNNHLIAIIQGIQAAQTDSNSFNEKWVETFSYNSAFPASSASTKQILGLVSSLVSILLAPIPEAGIIIALVSGVTTTISNAIPPPTDENFATSADLGSYIGIASESSTSATQSLGMQLFSGESDSAGNHIWDYLRGGGFAKPSPYDAQNIGAFIRKQYVAGAINYLYRNQRTYILSVDSSDCANDHRGPEESKLCLPEDQGTKVYYAYMIPLEGTQWPQVLFPTNYQEMPNYEGLTIQDAMAASIRAYNIAKFDYESVRQQRWLNLLEGSQSDNGLPGYDFEGMFTIPVCRNPNGIFISAIADNHDRHFPCFCKDSLNNSPDETVDFVLAAGMNNWEKWTGFCTHVEQCESSPGVKAEDLDPSANNTFSGCPGVVT